MSTSECQEGALPEQGEAIGTRSASLVTPPHRPYNIRAATGPAKPAGAYALNIDAIATCLVTRRPMADCRLISRLPWARFSFPAMALCCRRIVSNFSKGIGKLRHSQADVGVDQCQHISLHIMIASSEISLSRWGFLERSCLVYPIS